MFLNLIRPGFIEICPLSPKFRALSYILAEGALCPGGMVGGGVGSVGGATAGLTTQEDSGQPNCAGVPSHSASSPL